MQAPIQTVQIGMGENILILAFVVIIIGGIGSVRGAFVAALLVGLIDTIGRAFLPDLMRLVLSSRNASAVGAGAVVDADLSPDGGRAGVAPAKACSRCPANERRADAAERRRCLPADLPRPGAGLPGDHRQHLRDDAVHPHHHPGDGGDQPQSHARLRRHGELRPRRLSRPRRLCGRHPGAGGDRLRAWCSGRSRSRCRRCSR